MEKNLLDEIKELTDKFDGVKKRFDTMKPVGEYDKSDVEMCKRIFIEGLLSMLVLSMSAVKYQMEFDKANKEKTDTAEKDLPKADE